MRYLFSCTHFSDFGRKWLYFSEPNKSIRAFYNSFGLGQIFHESKMLEGIIKTGMLLGYRSIRLFLKQIVECQEQLSRLLYQAGTEDPCRPVLD